MKRQSNHWTLTATIRTVGGSEVEFTDKPPLSLLAIDRHFHWSYCAPPSTAVHFFLLFWSLIRCLFSVTNRLVALRWPSRCTNVSCVENFLLLSRAMRRLWKAIAIAQIDDFPLKYEGCCWLFGLRALVYLPFYEKTWGICVRIPPRETTDLEWTFYSWSAESLAVSFHWKLPNFPELPTLLLLCSNVDAEPVPVIRSFKFRK